MSCSRNLSCGINLLNHAEETDWDFDERLCVKGHKTSKSLNDGRGEAMVNNIGVKCTI